MLYLINALSRTKFFIIKIAYKYLSRYLRLLFKKHIINSRIIILKLYIYINYSNENIIKKYIKITIVIYVNNCHIYKRIKALKNRKYDLLQLFSISQKC